MIVFGTKENLRLLCEVDTIYVDGTFRTCPTLFYQIFSLHGFKNGKQFPLVYALLPDKTRQTYSRLFELVKQKVVSFGLSLDPSKFLGDFELAIKQSVDLTFPLAEFKGCYFHFTQALMRKFQTIGLQVAYRSDEEAKQFLRKTAALAFVPTKFVRLAWQGIKASAPSHLPRIEEFIEYFESTWLVGSFPLSMWNIHDNDEYRTNNHVEGWHKRLKSLVGKAHPNIYEFVEVIKKEQTATEILIAQLGAGATVPKRSSKTIVTDKKIKELRDRFDQNDISVEEYLHGVSYHISL